MRHILAVLTLGATLALSATAAFAYGDGLEYAGPGLRQTVTAVDIQTPASDSLVMAGSVDTSQYWIRLRYENFVR